MASDDPDFESKAAAIMGLYLGLYLKPPAHAAVFGVDEKSAFRLSIDLIRFCLCRSAAPSAMALNISGMARCRFTPLWRFPAGKSWAKRPRATQRRVRRLSRRRGSTTKAPILSNGPIEIPTVASDECTSYGVESALE